MTVARRGAAREGKEVGEEKVSRVACAIFRERGYHQTSMRDIASALGWQPSALYYYYPSKEDLLFAIMDAAVTGLTAMVKERIDPEACAVDRLRQAIRAHIEVIADHLDELSVFLHEMKSLDDPKRREILVAKRSRYEHIYRDIIHEGIEAGEFRDVDPRLARFMILSACNWLYSWYRPDGPYHPQQIADSFCDMLLGGLITRPQHG
jgi:AcrR family transcriptional regulator